MPRKPKRPCRYGGCPNLTGDKSGYCDVHKGVGYSIYNKFFRSYRNSERYGYQWRKIRAMYLAENPLCEMCKREGRFTDATEVHHIKPLADGGTNDFTNLMPLCKSCHSRITLTDFNLRGGGRKSARENLKGSEPALTREKTAFQTGANDEKGKTP